MWKQDVPMQVNPISLVTVKGASKRIRQPHSLTVEQFRLLVSQLKEPFDLMSLVCICFGLRISECLALKWSDVDWLNGLLRVERGIVEQNVDDVKTDESRKQDITERWKKMNRTNLIESLEACLFLTQSSCKVPDVLESELKTKVINLSQYFQKGGLKK